MLLLWMVVVVVVVLARGIGLVLAALLVEVRLQRFQPVVVSGMV